MSLSIASSSILRSSSSSSTSPLRPISLLLRVTPSRSPLSLSLLPPTSHFSTTTPTHGLEEFFENNKGWNWDPKSLPTGRAWTSAELRAKSFDDLHKLWFVCYKERNKLVSQKEEGRRFRIEFPHDGRMVEVKKTMARIKQVLWERKLAFEEAQSFQKELLQKEQLIKAIQKRALVKNNSTLSDEDALAIVEETLKEKERAKEEQQAAGSKGRKSRRKVKA